MRRDLFDSLLIGASIGFIALAIHALTDGSAPHYQLLALTLAGAALFGVHLALALRRRQQARGRKETVEHEHEPAPEAFLRDRRNPFFRELTRDWTGLDDYPSTDTPPRDDANANAHDTARPHDHRGDDGK